MIGRIKNIQPSYYGFITDELGQDYFFHGSSYQGNFETLRRISPPKASMGPMVEFDQQESHRGLRACNVKLFKA